MELLEKKLAEKRRIEEQEEARLKAEQEAMAKAEEEARLKEEYARIKAWIVNTFLYNFYKDTFKF